MANRASFSHNFRHHELQWAARSSKPNAVLAGRREAMAWCLLVSGLLASVFGGPSRAWADETGEREPRRAALVAGVNKYRPTSRLSDLHFAEQDARDLADVLREAGYDVVELTARAALTTQEPRLVPTAAYLRDELERLLETPDEAPGRPPPRRPKTPNAMPCSSVCTDTGFNCHVTPSWTANPTATEWLRRSSISARRTPTCEG